MGGRIRPEGMSSLQADTYFGIDVHRDESLEALPLLHLPNRAINKLKDAIQDGREGCSLRKAAAYLGYRIISYSLIPMVSNLISLVLATILTVITLPTRCCGKALNRWCFIRMQGSFVYLIQSGIDFTSDLRRITSCCCSPDSAWREL